MIKKNYSFILSAIFLFIFSLLHCKTYGENKRNHLPGKNYFDPAFECEKGLLDKEKNILYLKSRDQIRKNFLPVKEKPFMVITGESTLALFPQEIYQKFLPEYNIVNRAIGGETTVLYLLNIEEDILSLNPDIILISIGGNDLLGGRCLNQIINNLNLIFYKIRTRLPETYIIFASIPPVLSWKVNTISPYVNQKIQNLLMLYPKTIYLDLWDILAEEEKPELSEKFYRKLDIFPLSEYDKLHFNIKGYEEIAKKLKPILDSIYKEKYIEKK